MKKPMLDPKADPSSFDLGGLVVLRKCRRRRHFVDEANMTGAASRRRREAFSFAW
jgi:hypothetical protein